MTTIRGGYGTSVKKKVTQAPASFQVIARACRDPKDNMVLECCDEAGADILITEDDRGGLRYYNIVLQSTTRAGNGKGKSDKKVVIYHGPRQAD